MTVTELPQFWDFLVSADKNKYIYMRMTLSSPACKNLRNHSKQTFWKIMNTIKNFCVRNDSDDWKRCLVCGIFWLPENQIAVNSKQLCLLLSKCKSSINGSLQLLGYYTVPDNQKRVKEFVSTLPLSKKSIIELVKSPRQWTIRQFATSKLVKKKSSHGSNSPVFSFENRCENHIDSGADDNDIFQNDDIQESDSLFDLPGFDFRDDSII